MAIKREHRRVLELVDGRATQVHVIAGWTRYWVRKNTSFQTFCECMIDRSVKHHTKQTGKPLDRDFSYLTDPRPLDPPLPEVHHAELGVFYKDIGWDPIRRKLNEIPTLGKLQAAFEKQARDSSLFTWVGDDDLFKRDSQGYVLEAVGAAWQAYLLGYRFAQA